MKTTNLRNILPFAASLAVLAILALPVLVFAQGWADGSTGRIDEFTQEVIEFINSIIVPLLFAIALALFIWGAVVFLIAGGGEDDKRDEGKTYMFWGLIALVIIVSVWGITNLIAGGLGLDQQDLDFIPSAENTN